LHTVAPSAILTVVFCVRQSTLLCPYFPSIFQAWSRVFVAIYFFPSVALKKKTSISVPITESLFFLLSVFALARERPNSSPFG